LNVFVLYDTLKQFKKSLHVVTEGSGLLGCCTVIHMQGWSSSTRCSTTFQKTL